MTISSISSNFSTMRAVQDPAQQIQQYFSDLESSLESGDLSGAQKAYSALRKLFQQGRVNSQNSDSSSASNNPLAADFQAIGKALQSGDLSAAQSALSKLQQDAQSLVESQTQSGNLAGLGRHHRHQHNSSHLQSADSTTSSDSSSTGADTASDSTISLLG